MWISFLQAISVGNQHVCYKFGYLFQAGIAREQLLIALEPEAASLYCKHLPVERLQAEGGAQGFVAFSKGSKYLVLDCGGTVYSMQHLIQITVIILSWLRTDL